MGTSMRPTPDGTMGGERSGPVSPTQKMRANLEWLRSRGASPEEQKAEIDRWRPKIAEYNQREQAGAGSFGNLAAQALTANFGDEIAGAADAVGALVPGGQSPGEAYRSTRNAIAGTNNALRTTQPGKALAVELGTGLASGIGTGFAAAKAAPGFLAPAVRAIGRALPASSAAGRVAQTTGAGAIAGAAAGAGGAEPGQRLRGAGTGAALGAGVAAGMGLGGAVLGGAAKRVGFGPRAPDTRLGKLRETLGMQTPDDAAAVRVGDAVGSSGKTLEDVLGRADFDETAVLGDVDVGGQRAAKLLGTGRRLGETATERVDATLGARARGRGRKIGSDLTRISGVNAFNPAREMDDLLSEARKAAKPLYDELDQFPAVRDARVVEAIDLIPPDRVRALWKNVQDLSRMEGRKLRPLLDADGAMAFDLEPSEMDLLKKGLDEIIYSGSRQAKMGQPGGLTNAETSLLKRARSLLVEAADEATGGPDGVYARARAAYGGPVAIREALESGADLPRMSVAEVESATEGLSQSQRGAFGRGGVQALRETLERTDAPGRTGLARGFQTTQREAQAKAALGDVSFPKWQNLLRGEQAREETERVVMRGSPTAERVADDLEMLATSVPTSKAGMLGAVGDVVKGPLERFARGTTKAEADAVTRILTESIADPKIRAEVLRLLQSGQAARAEITARAALRSAGVAGAVGGRGPQDRSP